jgi:site-specific DNA-cytosine methylase
VNILSLFDGISCGQVALQRTGILYDKYYASEIHKWSIQVTQKHFPNTIQLGDVRKVDTSSLPKIDLLIGGSPCQGFTNEGNLDNFQHKQSQLFWEYKRILDELRVSNPDILFLLENVKMKKEFRDIISKALGVEPIEINSNLVSAQNRKRFYWTNIPDVTQPQDKCIKLIDILENTNFPNKPWSSKYKADQSILYTRNKFRTIKTKGGGATNGVGVCDEKGYWRRLTSIELERLQTLPDNYTEGYTDYRRHYMIGDGWTVDIIAHILRNIEK